MGVPEYTCDPFGISVFPAQRWEHARMTNFPCMNRSRSSTGETRYLLGDPLVVDCRDTDSSIMPARPMGGVTTTDTGETVHSLKGVDMDEVIHAFHTLSPGQVT
jgi:hypothetical protein